MAGRIAGFCVLAGVCACGVLIHDLVASHLAKSKGFRLYIAKPWNGMCGDEDRRLILAVADTGVLKLNGEIILPKDVQKTLKRALNRRGDQSVFIFADRAARVADVLNAVDAAYPATDRLGVLTAKVNSNPGRCGPNTFVLPTVFKVVPNQSR